MFKKLRFNIGFAILTLGAKLWQPAFDKGNYETYNELTFSEKVGYRLFVAGIVIADIKETVYKMALEN